MWFLENIPRLQKERREISRLLEEDWLLDADWAFDNNRLCFIATIRAHDNLYPIKLVYPNVFPANPPSVYPQESNQRWSGHQYGIGGELCLEWGPDNWQEQITGANLLRSAHKLLMIENPGGEEGPRAKAPSRHSLTLGQEVRSAALRFICNSSLIDYLRSNPQQETGLVKIKLFSYLPVFTAFIASIEEPDGEKWENLKLSTDFGKGAIDVEGRYLQMAMDSSYINSLTKETFIDLLDKYHVTDVETQDLPYVFLLLSCSNDDLYLFWLTGNKELYRFRTITVQDTLSHDRLSPDFERLSNKSVGIVGLGSAGSKIALSLARSGVQDFYLVDHDIFLPENIYRHELNWEDVGQHKVDAMKYQLGLISSEVKVSTNKLMLSGQEASASVDSVLSKLGKCDVIIDATADSPVFNQLSAIASQYKKPLLWLEVFAGGIGGLLARSRPGIDPTPNVMRAHFLDYLENQDESFPKTTTDYSAITDGGNPIVATDADVGVVASFATQMAIDLLLERVPSFFPYSMYLIGMSRGWIFQEPFYTIPLDLSEVQSDTVEIKLEKDDTNEALEFIKGLVEKLDDESSPST
jgi:molybdopterin/thiamine biosynthesis adenylyltransferase